MFIWFAIKESCRKLTVRTIGNLFLIPGHICLIFFRSLHIIINCLAISSCNSCHIKSSLHTSFNLQAVDTTVQDIIHMLYHTEILGVEDISSSLILKYRHIFTRTFFFHNRIFPTTRMCACPLIRISSNQIIAEQASSGIRNTHCSMNKSLDFHIIRNMFTDLTDFFQRKFPCRYDTFRAELIPETVCLIVCIVCLCTDMAFYFRTNFTGIGKNSRICNDQCIRFQFFQLLQIFSDSRKVIIMRQNIYCHINLYSMFMCKRNSLCHIFL